MSTIMERSVLSSTEELKIANCTTIPKMVFFATSANTILFCQKINKNAIDLMKMRSVWWLLIFTAKLANWVTV